MTIVRRRYIYDLVSYLPSSSSTGHHRSNPSWTYDSRNGQDTSLYSQAYAFKGDNQAAMHLDQSLGVAQAGQCLGTRLCMDEQRHGSRACRRPDLDPMDLDGLLGY